MTSWREVSQLAKDIFPPSNCWITLLLVTAEDLLLTQMASHTVFAHFCWGSGGGGGGGWASWEGRHLRCEQSGGSNYHHSGRGRCCLFSHSGKRKGAVWAQIPPLCPGLLLPSVVCSLPLAGWSSSGWRDEGGAAAGAAILGMKVSFSIVLCTSYSTRAQLQLSMHSW
jgi:hypothetical protein